MDATSSWRSCCYSSLPTSISRRIYSLSVSTSDIRSEKKKKNGSKVVHRARHLPPFSLAPGPGHKAEFRIGDVYQRPPYTEETQQKGWRERWTSICKQTGAIVYHKGKHATQGRDLTITVPTTKSKRQRWRISPKKKKKKESFSKGAGGPAIEKSTATHHLEKDLGTGLEPGAGRGKAHEQSNGRFKGERFMYVDFGPASNHMGGRHQRIPDQLQITLCVSPGVFSFYAISKRDPKLEYHLRHLLIHA